MKPLILIGVLAGFLVSGCTAAPVNPTQAVAAPTATATYVALTPTLAPPPLTTTPTSTPQPRLTEPPSGPDLENFHSSLNPLTGLRQQDPVMLDLPAVLVSISNMPPTARPQAGTSFADWIYEMFIGEGTTRFMAVFYGDLPRRIPNDRGGCELNKTTFKLSRTWVGNRVWLDENQDGVQDPWEAGVSGVCITLKSAAGDQLISSTSTDSNGYYAFDASALSSGVNYTLVFKLPPAYQFSPPGVGDDDHDSDATPPKGEALFTFTGQVDKSLDAGLLLVKPGPIDYAGSDIAHERTYVGPIRSGRLTYNDFVQMFPAGCLVYASAGEGIRQQLTPCEIIQGEQPQISPNTALLDVSHLKELAQKSRIPNQPVNYSGHLFDPIPPAGGEPARSLWVYFHLYSQSYWEYDPVSGSYLRQTDDGDGKGNVHPDTDRLTGRQLAFQNVVVIMADYEVFRHGQYDIALCCGLEGYAFLFRDGQMYRIRWSTNNGAWEEQTGLRRPLHLTSADKLPFPLKPGRTWVAVMTTNSFIKDYLNDGRWQAVFSMPNDFAPQK
ncbi:MAG TPA: SdrD B-like domain-containing protein [Anaerolineales bacterium]|jgi:hypothetical protein